MDAGKLSVPAATTQTTGSSFVASSTKPPVLSEEENGSNDGTQDCSKVRHLNILTTMLMKYIQYSSSSLL